MWGGPILWGVFVVPYGSRVLAFRLVGFGVSDKGRFQMVPKP